MKEKDNKEQNINKDTEHDQSPHTTQSEQEESFCGNTDTDSRNFPIKREEQLPNDARFAFTLKSTDDFEPEKNKKGKKKSAPNKSLWLQTLIMGISFLTAFLILALSLISSRAPVTSEPPSITDAAESEAQRTVFIKEYDSTSGILAPQQIYADALESVVSVKATKDGASSIGSGFVFDSEGRIVTAHHVIEGMSDITIISSDKKEYKASVIASDELCDLALLKTDATTLPPLEMGDSSSLLVGDELMAIGTPASLELAGSMTRADVAFTDRQILIYDEESGALEKKMTLIQTGADLNPGNSGGPVLDRYGKVVGIVTMKLGRGFEGISFLIPSSGALGVLNDMKNGIQPSDATRAAIATYAARLGVIAESCAYSAPDGKNLLGVRISDFSSEKYDSAKKLKKGDIIVSLDGKEVSSATSLAERVAEHSPGDTVSVTVYRSAQFLTFSIILGR